MKELVEVMAKSLVSNPSAVVVEEETTGTSTVLRLHVAPEDMGKVIGKQGRIAKAIRTVMKAVATRENVKVVVEICLRRIRMVNDMDKMFVRVPVAIKAKVTEDLKLKIIGDVQNTIKTINLDIEHFEFQAKKALSQAASDLSVLPSLREQIEMERNKINAAKAEAEDKLKRAEALEIGAEIGHGTLERTVEITIGTDIDALMGAEILTEDGKIIAFRE